MLSWSFLEIDAQLGIINFNFMDYILLSIVGGLRIGDTASSTPTATNDNYLQGSLTVSQVVSNRQQSKPRWVHCDSLILVALFQVVGAIYYQ